MRRSDVLSQTLGPFPEWQVRGDDDRAAPGALRSGALQDDFRGQFRARPAERHKARFVGNQQVPVRLLLLHALQPALTRRRPLKTGPKR